MTDDAKEPTTEKPEKAKLTNAAKREAVMAALKSDPAQADRQLARQCGVSHTYVAKLRAKLNGNVATPDAGNTWGKRGNVSKSGAKSKSNGNVAKCDVDTVGNDSSVEDPRAMFFNLGVALVEQDGQWLRQACEKLLATIPAKPKRTKSESTNGIFCAHEAINCLKRIQKDDAFRKRGYQIVTDWIRYNQ